MFVVSSSSEIPAIFVFSAIFVIFPTLKRRNAESVHRNIKLPLFARRLQHSQPKSRFNSLPDCWSLQAPNQLRKCFNFKHKHESLTFNRTSPRGGSTQSDAKQSWTTMQRWAHKFPHVVRSFFVHTRSGKQISSHKLPHFTVPYLLLSEGWCCANKSRRIWEKFFV